MGPPAGDAGRRLRTLGETCLWLLVVAAAVVAAVYVASRLRLVVLPVLLAVVLATFLVPPAAALKRRGWPDGVAALAVLVAAAVAVAAVAAALVPAAADDFAELDVGLDGGFDEVQRWLAEGPLGLSDDQVTRTLDRLQAQVRDNAGAVTSGLLTGAVLLVEVVAGLVLAAVVLFFLLKDGDRIWDWLCRLAPPPHRDDVRAVGERSWKALGGFLRGQTLVALFDAVFLALALVLIGVPLVLPLAVLTFAGAYVPVVGATVAGLAAVLVALFAEGPVAAALVLAAIVVIQQVEGNVLEPVIVGRTTHVHPLAVLLGVTTGAVLAGVIGAMVAGPAVAVGSAVLAHVREASEGGAPPGG